MTVLHDRENPVRDPGISHGAFRVLARSSNAKPSERFVVVTPNAKDARFLDEKSFHPTEAAAEAEAIRLHAASTQPADSGVRLVETALRVVRGGK